jgi:radical SAM superfamily enzyme YgiQ (UPF0313 family)
MSGGLLFESNPAPRQRWRILLISINRYTTPEPVFPIGLAHLTAALRDAGYEVDWLDLLMDESNLQERLLKERPNLVGISVRNIDDVLIRRRETFVGQLADLVSAIHEQLRCPVVLGGSGFSIFPRELLQMSGADFGVIGEGETTLRALAGALEGGHEVPEHPGLITRQASAFTVNRENAGSSRDWRADLPPKIAVQYLERGGVLNVQTQRGCSHRCCYCTYPLIEGRRHRYRNADAVVAEFEQLERVGARYAFVVDSVFNSSELHVQEICEALVRNGSKLRWGCFLRPQGLTGEIMRLMVRAGLAHVEFGSDSFCDEVLQAYDKALTFEDIRRSTELARQEDVDFCHFVIAGGPGETDATLRQGYENSQLLGNPIIMAVPGMRIYPGTRLFERAVDQGQVDQKTSLLEPVYYLAPGLTLEQVIGMLKSFAALSPNWVVGDFDPVYESLAAKLRRRGVSGPLWSYFAAAQRVWGARKPGA